MGHLSRHIHFTVSPPTQGVRHLRRCRGRPLSPWLCCRITTRRCASCPRGTSVACRSLYLLWTLRGRRPQRSSALSRARSIVVLCSYHPCAVRECLRPRYPSRLVVISGVIGPSVAPIRVIHCFACSCHSLWYFLAGAGPSFLRPARFTPPRIAVHFLTR